MSTKTTFKRVALVAVAALGLGVVSSVAPANAAAASFTVNTASQTVVGTYATTNNSTKGAVAFVLTVKSNAATPVNANLVNGETITASVIGIPGKSLASGDVLPLTGNIEFLNVKNSTTLAADSATAGTLSYLDNNCTQPNALDATAAAQALTGKYCIGVMPSLNISGWGEYTIAFDLKDVNGNILQRTTVKYKMVASAADSGAVVTISTGGTVVAGETYLQTADKYMNASLRDANGGLIVVNDTTVATRRPALTATLESATGTELNVLTASDTGVDTADAADASATASDGDYGLIPSAAVSSNVSTTAASVVRVRYGLVNVTGAISALPTAGSVSTAGTFAISGAGLVMSSPTTDTTTANSARTYQVPLSTTSITLSWILRNAAGTALVNEPVTVSTVWTGTNAGSVTPVSGSTGAVVKRSDNTGLVTYTVTQSAPLTGSQAVVSVAGQLAGGTAYGDTTLLWRVPTLTTISTSPGASFKAVAASSVSVTATALDQFGAPMAGVVLQPGISGTTSPNYTATAKATLTTGADGKATYTITGGAASTTITDTVTFSGAAGTISATARTITYVAALPVAATLTGAYTLDQSSSTYANLFSTSAITNAGVSLVLDRTMDTSATISVAGTSASDAQFKMQVQALDSAAAAVTGVPVVVTATDGAWMRSSSTGKVVKTLTLYPSTTGYVTVDAVLTKTGTSTYTFTHGTTVLTQTVSAKNATADARNVSLTASGSDVTTKVTDRFGNAVAGINVQLSTSVGTLGNGQKTSVYTTNTSGEIAIVVDVDGATTVTAYLSDANDSTSIAGYSGTSIIDATVPAGIRTATAAVTGTGSVAATAQAAVDAAAEATDAANAATDAANAAAEAADAATAAAQDAADAVAALSAQVSTMMSSLKAQLTALTNLVIKIQKKVKA
jgi:hypothetical protein